ncbi:MAG: putative membrane protein [Marivirga sp.]
MKMNNSPLITNDAVVFGLLMMILAAIFITSSSKNSGWKKFYKFIPSVLLCYFIPSLFNTFGVISGDESNLYFIASRYLLPTSLVLLTLSVDFKGIARLGKKAVIMFLTGTVGIVIGGPLAILITSTFAPEIVGGVGPDAVWRGMTTIAGSWIGGGANQAAMFEAFGASDDLFATMITVDVIVANIWMAFLLYGVGISKKLDKKLKADASAIDELKRKISDYQLSIMKIPSLSEVMTVLAVGFGATAIAHFGADLIAPWIAEHAPQLDKFSLTSGFFWIVVIATTIGLSLSFTSAKKLEGVGASRLGSVMIYILVATIGMKMDVTAILDNPGFFLVGIIWMSVHVILLLIVAKLIKAPYFFVAVGSQANVGGAASAPIVAGAFHPSLAPVGVLLAVLGYALGTYAAYICGLLMQLAAN